MPPSLDTRRQWLIAAALAALGAGSLPAWAQSAGVGQSAPDFELLDTQGKRVRLSDFKGRHVVLEWTNPGCPFVVKHYGSQNMQGLQKEAMAKNVVWLSISSTAQGHADYLAPAALAAQYRQWGAAPTAMLMDDSGQVGRAYGARTTPHMYLIDPKGVLVYAGGIDDKRSSSPEDVKTAKNFVRVALGESLAGKPVSTPTTAPYGCSVKYAAG
jgi:peroxiredoxin